MKLAWVFDYKLHFSSFIVVMPSVTIYNVNSHDNEPNKQASTTFHWKWCVQTLDRQLVHPPVLFPPASSAWPPWTIPVPTSSARSRSKCWAVGPGTLCSGWSGWRPESPSKEKRDAHTKQRAKLCDAAGFLEGLKFDRVFECFWVSFIQNNDAARLNAHWMKQHGLKIGGCSVCFILLYSESWQVGCLDAWSRGKTLSGELNSTQNYQ